MKWNNVRDYWEYQGDVEIGGSWDAIRYAFNRNLISDGALWLEIVQDCILSVHTYDEATAEKMLSKIYDVYSPLILQL